jgi:hypothetical protein
MGAVRVSWQQALRWRMRRQLLVRPAHDAVEVARRLGGIHAQVASCSRLIAGVRSAASPDLDTALWDGRTLVRTWAARGTLHLLPADELDLWVGALTDRDARRRFPPSWEREHGVTAAAARGLLCSGPTRDGAVTFVGPAAWLGRHLAPAAPAAANRDVLRRFLAANGPATAADVARWWGEQPAPAKRWISDAADALAPVEVGGEAGFVDRAEDADELAATPDGGADPADAPVLLPGFDPWVIAPRSHRRHAIPQGREPEVSRTAGWISPVLVVDGRIAGVWDDTAGIAVRPFAPLPTAVRRAVEKAAPAAVTWA